METVKKIIGMIVPTVDNSFFSNLANHVEKCMNEKGFHTLIVSSANHAEKEKEYLRKLVSLGAEGVICVSGLSELPDDLLPDDFPLVWVDRHPGSARRIPWVANDDAAAMEKATEYLIQKGCKNILLLPGFLAEHHESPRVEGYRNALKKNGIPVSEDFILNRPGEKSTEEEAEEMVRAAIGRGVLVEGIITSSDRAAFGAVAALRSVGYYVPEDVKLISFDNSPYSAMASPSVTALDRNPEILAEKACEILIQILDKKDVAVENIVPVSFVKRDSTR